MRSLDNDLLRSNIEKAAEYDFSHNKVFGSAYCVMQEDHMLYQGCFGTTSVQSDTPVTDTTLFRLASMTKPVTAVAALVLIDRGLLHLSDPLSKYLPQWQDVRITSMDSTGHLVDLGTAQNAITICHLLTHTSGIGCTPAKDTDMTSLDKLTLENSLSYHHRMGLDFEPGTMQQYSSTAAFDALALVVEQISGMNYADFLQQEIFEPCGMTDTTFAPSDAQWKRMIDMHTQISGKNAISQRPDGCVFEAYPCTHHLGGAGLASTLRDYALFAKMLLNNGKTDKKQLLSEESVRLMRTAFVSEDIMPGNECWGLGVRVIVKEAYEDLAVGTFGWSGAYGSHFWVDPENKIAAVFMKNSCFDGGAGNESARHFEKAVRASFV